MRSAGGLASLSALALETEKTMPHLVDSVVGETMCVACARCDELVPVPEWERGIWVCPACGLHYPLGAHCRITTLLDPNSMRLLPRAPMPDGAVFGDTERYADRLADARDRTGLSEVVLCARGRIGGEPVVVAVFDFEFLAGSIGTVAGEMLTEAAETALVEEIPLVLVTAYGTTRVEEGTIALMQIAKVAAVFGQLDDAGVLTVALLTKPVGGVGATFAMRADVVLAEPDWMAPDGEVSGSDSAMALQRSGFVDMVVPRKRLRSELAALISATATQRARPVPFATDRPGRLIIDPGRLPEIRHELAIERVTDPARPTTVDYIDLVFDDFHELHGDRTQSDSGAIVAGLAGLSGRPVIVAGHQPRDPGQPYSESCWVTPAAQRKLTRVLRLAAKLSLPVVTLIDTPGADPSDGLGAAAAIAESLSLMSTLPVPVVSVITGTGGGLGALALGVANRVLMCSDAVYTAAEPDHEGAVTTRVTARDALLLGVADGVIAEPRDGWTDHAVAAQYLRDALLGTFAELGAMSVNELIADRWTRFRRYGAWGSVTAEAEAIVEQNRTGD
jgi:acetyl-CoA carboxylase carboxyl transferase subunit beta